MDNFLEEQAAQGAADSEGVFTVAWAKRRHKLRKFQEGYPAFYLLKLFQAAYRCRPEEIRVQLESQSVILEFELATAREELVPEHLHRLLSREEAYPKGILHHLLTGLNGAVLAGTEAIWGCSEGGALRLDEGSLECLPDWSHPREVEEGVRYRFQLRRHEGRMEEEREGLLARCCYGLIPLQLNHRTVHPRWPRTPEANWHKAHLKACDLIRFFECGEAALRLPRVNLAARRLHQGFWLYRKEKRSLDKTFAAGWSEPEQAFTQGPCAAAYLIPMGLEGPATLLFVKDGVLLDPVPIATWKFGAVALFLGDDVEVDLSEFGVLQGQNLRPYLSRASQTWSTLLGRAAEDLVGASQGVTSSDRTPASWGGLETLPVVDLVFGAYTFLSRLFPGSVDPVEQAQFQSQFEKRLKAALSQSN